MNIIIWTVSWAKPSSILSILAILSGLYMFRWARRQGDRRKAWLWLLLAAAPVFYVAAAQLRAVIEPGIRQRQVAAIPTTPLSPGHPRLLDVYGRMDHAVAAALLTVGKFDNVMLFDPEGRVPGASVYLYKPVRKPECLEMANAVLKLVAAGGELKNQNYEYNKLGCADREQLMLGPSGDGLMSPHKSSVDAVVFWTNDPRLNFSPFGPGLSEKRQTEVRQRIAGAEQLVAHREQLIIQRPMFSVIRPLIMTRFDAVTLPSGKKGVSLQAQEMLLKALGL